jgi:hypothetical protein
VSRKAFGTDAVLTLATGAMVCEDFGDMHELVEFLTGEPVWAHQLANRPFVDALQAEIIRQHDWLAEAVASQPDFTTFLTTEGKERVAREFVARFAAEHGNTVEVEQIEGGLHVPFTAGLEHLGQNRERS